MIRLPPRTTRTYTLFPYTTLFRSQNGGFEDFVHRYAVVQVLDGFFQDEVGVDLVRQVLASLGNGGAQLSQIERAFDAVVGNVERALLGRRLGLGVAGAFLRALFTVKHIEIGRAHV